MIPSTEALYRHWRRTCWVLDMWKKANNNHMVLHPLANFGWKVTNESLTFDWDSGNNMEAVRQRVIQLLKGCKCKNWLHNFTMWLQEEEQRVFRRMCVYKLFQHTVKHTYSH